VRHRPTRKKEKTLIWKRKTTGSGGDGRGRPVASQEERERGSKEKRREREEAGVRFARFDFLTAF